MTQAIKTEEPSIDEVLTRIRRVVGDDNSAKIAKRISESPPAPETQTSYSVPLNASPHADEQAPMPATVRGSALDAEAQGELISKKTQVTVNSAFSALAQNVLRHNSQTLEDMLRAMLRPILKAWLDDNLPSMVERLVRAEIERISNVGPGPTSR